MDNIASDRKIIASFGLLFGILEKNRDKLECEEIVVDDTVISFDEAICNVAGCLDVLFPVNGNV